MGKENKNSPVISSRTKTYWDLFIFLLIVYSVFEMPFSMVFQIKNQVIFYVNFLIDVLFLVDLTLNSYIAIRAEQDTEEKNYFQSWFWIDFPAAFPAVILSIIFDHFASISGISMIKVVRIIRVAKIFQAWTKIGNVKATQLSYNRIIIFLLVTSITAHWISLGWIYVGGIQNTNGPVSTYINSLYWTITTFTTIGYGDITPKNDKQKLFAMVVMVIGAGLYGYIIGNITSFLSNMDHTKISFTERLEKIGKFLAYKKIPKDLQETIFSYYGYLWESHRGYNESEIMKELPHSLRMKVALYMNKNIIEKIPIFQNASEEIITEIVLQLKPVIFTPGDFIFKSGEEGNQMYFVSNGNIEILDEKKSIVYATMTEGGYFGEMALLFSAPRSASAKAVSYCDLYSLDREHFLSIIEKYPDFANEIRRIAKARIENSYRK